MRHVRGIWYHLRKSGALQQKVDGMRRQSALDAYEELVTYAPDREWRLILIDSSLEDVDAHKKHVMGDFLSPACHVGK